MPSTLDSLPEAELTQDLAIASARTVALSALLSFSAIGFHATTTRHITERAAVSVGSLYTHFRSKEDILYYWTLAGHRSALAVLGHALEQASDAEDQVAAIVHDLTRWHIHYQTLSQVATTQLRALNAEHYAEVRQYRQEISEGLGGPIDAGQRLGAFRITDRRLLMNALFAMILDVSRWFPRDGSLDAASVASGYAALARAMLRASSR